MTDPEFCTLQLFMQLMKESSQVCLKDLIQIRLPCSSTLASCRQNQTHSKGVNTGSVQTVQMTSSPFYVLWSCARTLTGAENLQFQHDSYRLLSFSYLSYFLYFSVFSHQLSKVHAKFVKLPSFVMALRAQYQYLISPNQFISLHQTAQWLILLHSSLKDNPCIIFPLQGRLYKGVQNDLKKIHLVKSKNLKTVGSYTAEKDSEGVKNGYLKDRVKKGTRDTGRIPTQQAEKL